MCHPRAQNLNAAKRWANNMNDEAKKKETLAKLDVAIANAEKIGSKTGDAGRTLGKNFQPSAECPSSTKG